jgi:hypothetical protein
MSATRGDAVGWTALVAWLGDRAIGRSRVSVYVIRAVIELRERVATNAALLTRLAEIDKSLLKHDMALRDIYQKLLPLPAQPPEAPRRQIGFFP